MKKALSTIILSTVAVTYASQGIGLEFYNDRGREGWFFYDDPLPEEEVEKEEPPPPPPKPATAKREVPPEPRGPVPLSSAWLEENLPKYLNRAIDTQDEQDIVQYMVLQKIAADKADKFSEGWQRVVQRYPQLDANSNRSLSTFAAKQMDRTAAIATDNLMEELAGQSGLVMFFRSDCAPCMQEVPIMKSMANKYGFTVRAISLDGMPLPGDPFPDWQVDEGWAAKLGVSVTPTTFLVTEEGGFSMIGAGVMAMESMIARIKYAALDIGLIDEQKLDSTRPTAGQSHLLAMPAFDPEGEGVPEENALPETPWNNDPQRLLEYLSRQEVRR